MSDTPDKFQPYERFSKTEQLAAYLMLDFIDSGFPGEFVFETVQLSPNSSRYFSKLTVTRFESEPFQSQSMIVSDDEIEQQTDFSPDYYAERMRIRTNNDAALNEIRQRGHSIQDMETEDDE